MKQPVVYIMSNKTNSVLYTGVTSNIIKRVFDHQNLQTPGFTSTYKCVKLIFFECNDTMYNAIVREKQIKGWTRIKKIQLIETLNPTWKDLWSDLRWSC